MSNQYWIPPSDKEIEAILNKTNIQPRPLSLVKFSANSMFRKAYLTLPNGRNDSDLELANYSNLLYLGPIPNHFGHGAYVNLTTNISYVIDIEELVELDPDET